MAKEKIGGSQHIASYARSKDPNVNWLKVWKHNAHLVADALKRYSPYVLFHGDKRKTTTLPQGAPADEVEMPPDPEPKTESEGSDQDHDHEVMTTKLRLRVQLLDEEGNPRSGATYTLAFGGKKVEKIVNNGKAEDAPDELKLDDKGMLDVIIPNDKIPESNAQLRVKLPPPPSDDQQQQQQGDGSDEGDGSGEGQQANPPEEWLEWVLVIGRLDPIKGKAPDEWCIAGVQQRLNNLGFGAGTIDGICGRWTRASLARFQKKYEITEDQAEINRFQTVMGIDKAKHPFPNAIPGTKTRAALEKIFDTDATSLKKTPPPVPTSPKPPKPNVGQPTDNPSQDSGDNSGSGDASPPPQQEQQQQDTNPEIEEARRKVQEAEAKYQRTTARLQKANQEKSRAQFGGRGNELEVARREVNKASRENDKAYRDLVSARRKLEKLEGNA